MNDDGIIWLADTNDGVVNVSNIVIESDMASKESEIERWIELNAELRKYIESEGKKLEANDFNKMKIIGYALEQSIRSAEKIENNKILSNLPHFFQNPLFLIYNTPTVIKSAFLGNIGLLKKIYKAKDIDSDVYLYLEKREALEIYDPRLLVGFTLERLEDGYEFKGEDETGELREFKELDPKKTHNIYVPPEKDIEDFDTIKDYDFAYSAALLMLDYVENLCMKQGVEPKKAMIIDGNFGRYTKILD